MSATIKLDKDEKGKSVDSKLYRSMIISLLYLAASIPDILFATCRCARFQSDPKESHSTAVKRIIQYIGTFPKLGIWYPKNSYFTLLGYLDSDYAGCKIDRKKYIWYMLITREYANLLVLKKTTYSCSFYNGS